jgi:hypothetical protein
MNVILYSFVAEFMQSDAEIDDAKETDGPERWCQIADKQNRIVSAMSQDWCYKNHGLVPLRTIDKIIE